MNERLRQQIYEVRRLARAAQKACVGSFVVQAEFLLELVDGFERELAALPAPTRRQYNTILNPSAVEVGKDADAATKAARAAAPKRAKKKLTIMSQPDVAEDWEF